MTAVLIRIIVVSGVHRAAILIHVIINRSTIVKTPMTVAHHAAAVVFIGSQISVVVGNNNCAIGDRRSATPTAKTLHHRPSMRRHKQ